MEKNVIRNIRRRVLYWGSQNFQNYPWRTPEKQWHGLVAEVLLQRTRAAAVIDVFLALVNRYPDPIFLANESVEAIKQTIAPLGLPIRARQLKELAGAIANLNGDLPCKTEALRKLPGIGHYAAAAFVSMHCGKRAVIVDINVVRWLSRLLGVSYDGETRRKAWLIALADEMTPRNNSRSYNFAVLDFTMKICGRVPKCLECPIGPKLCEYGRMSLAGLDHADTCAVETDLE